MSKFSSLQLVAYRMPTYDALATAAYVPDSSSKIGAGLDAAARALLQRFDAVLGYAKSLSDIDTKTTTLKVFVAPEFYFKGVGDHWGSFSFNSMINVLAALKEISVPGPDWVVVAGTVIFYLPKSSGYQHSDGSAVKPSECVYANLAPVITQGGGLTYVLKHFISNIDYLPKPSSTVLESVWESDVFGPCLEEWTERKSRLVTVGDRTIGLEICLDHATKELSSVIDDYAAREKRAAPPVDLHLITSCGMTIKTPLARQNGYVALCDGLGRGSDVGSQLNKVGDKSNVDPIEPIQTAPLKGTLAASSTQSKPQQSIAVYPTQPLPG